METTPLEPYISPRKREEDERKARYELFEKIMSRVDAGYEDRAEAFQVLSQADAPTTEHILGCLATSPDIHLAEISYHEGSLVGAAPAEMNA
jgi:hypothetical protein